MVVESLDPRALRGLPLSSTKSASRMAVSAKVIDPAATWRLKPNALHLILAAKPVMVWIFVVKLVVSSTSARARVVQILSGRKNVTKICLSNPSPLNVGINTFD